MLLALIDAALLWAGNRPNDNGNIRGMAALGSALLLGVILSYPLLLPIFPTSGYIKGADPALYQFFLKQPTTIRIASLSDEVDNLPTFCHRSIIIGAECAVPFHPAYYLPLRDRGLQIARAQYSAEPAVVYQCARDQQIDFWLLDRKAFSRKYWHKSRLLRQLRLSAPGEDLGVVSGPTPVLQQPPIAAIAYQDAHYIVLGMHRLLTHPFAGDGRRGPEKL